MRNACIILALTPILLTILASASLSQTTPVTGLSPAAVIQFINQTIGWYHQLDVQRQIATEPTDVILFNDNQRMANHVVSLAFDFARAEAEAIEKQAGSNLAENQSIDLSRYQGLLKLSAKLDLQIRDIRAEVESLQQKLPAARGPQLRTLQTQIAETQSELKLAEAREDAVRSMVEFVGGSSEKGVGATGLSAEIEELARSVPAAQAKPSANQEAASSANEQIYPAIAAGVRKPEPTGVFGLIQDLFRLSRKIRALSGAIQATEVLSESSQELRAPLVNKLREMSKSGDELAKQADSANLSQLSLEKRDLDALTAQFKQTTAAVLPLSKQRVLLDLYSRNLTDWQSTIQNQYAEEMRSLLVRLAFLAVLLAAVIGASQLWRRAMIRYIHDPRRRYQFLLLRRIVLWCVIAAVLVSAFANELGSIATFAGLMTAGVAVALQNVILSIVGYFFLIGKYGIRVGDRVQVAGVTGEVVDIGPVRFHLLEIIGGGGKTPSGRVVAFSNSIVFQPNAELFKQIPGTNFGWHEITLTLSSDSDYTSVEERLRTAVESVFSQYQEEMDRQHRQIQRALTATPVGELRPRSRLRFTQSGVEIVIGYPVDLMHAAEINDRVTRELLKLTAGDPKLKLVGSGEPDIKR